MKNSIRILVPGSYLSDVAYLDLETRKVPTSPGFRLSATGEPLGRRWRAFLAGVARPDRIARRMGRPQAGQILILEDQGDETEFLRGVARAIHPADTVIYQASRRFDEMILKGRFTYARRGPEPVPFFPAMPGAEDLTWDQRSYRERPARSPDVASKFVPGSWERNSLGDRDCVRVHLLRDVVELILQAGEPDQCCEAWCRSIMEDYWIARDLIQDASGNKRPAREIVPELRQTRSGT